MPPATTILVDDNPHFLHFATQVLADHYADLLELRASCSAGAAIERCAALQPQFILLDLGLPGMTSLPLIRALRQAAPRAVVIVLSSSDEAPYVEASHCAGAAMLLGKETLNSTLRAAIGDLAWARGADYKSTCWISSTHN